MPLKSTPVFEIARLIDLRQPGQSGFCILVAPSPDNTIDSELQEELEVQTSSSLTRIDVGDMNVASLIERLHSAPHPTVMISGLESWGNDQLVSLDVNRSQLETGKFVIFKMETHTAARLLDLAPNLRSYVGASVFARAPDRSTMSHEEISNRLAQLRSACQMSDEDVVNQAENGSLPADPQFAEWLFLLGRSELVK